MHRQKEGFTIFELLVVIAVIAVVSAIVTPQIIGWRNSAKLRGAVGNLKGDLEMAKTNAIKENNYVAVSFADNGYAVFVDLSNDRALDDGEPVLRNRALPAGVAFDRLHPDWTFPSNVTGFNSRGTADNGTVVLINTKGEQKNVVISTLGRIRVETIH